MVPNWLSVRQQTESRKHIGDCTHRVRPCIYIQTHKLYRLLNPFWKHILIQRIFFVVVFHSGAFVCMCVFACVCGLVYVWNVYVFIAHASLCVVQTALSLVFYASCHACMLVLVCTYEYICHAHPHAHRFRLALFCCCGWFPWFPSCSVLFSTQLKQQSEELIETKSSGLSGESERWKAGQKPALCARWWWWLGNENICIRIEKKFKKNICRLVPCNFVYAQ